MKPTLVIMAAGLGSRYGGLKQMAPVGAGGELLMEYAVYDAIRAGFDKVVFVIKAELHADFESLVLRKLAGRIKAVCAVQALDDLPPGYSVPAGRKKPWGTGHAVWAARGEIDGPFCVINADDFYGREAFEAVGRFLQTTDETQPPYRCCMAGYAVENTLTAHGTVSRGVCTVDAGGMLVSVDERLRLCREGDSIRDLETGLAYPAGTPVSLNMWGFSAGVTGELEGALAAFLDGNQDPMKGEFYLPAFVDGLVRAGRASVAVLPVAARWYGVTYQEDRPVLADALLDMTKAGGYPAGLWGR